MSRSSRSSSSSSSSGLGLFSATFLVLLVLKLAEIGPVAHWSWWWVTSPLWGVAALAASVLLFLLGQDWLRKQRHRWRRRRQARDRAKG